MDCKTPIEEPKYSIKNIQVKLFNYPPPPQKRTITRKRKQKNDTWDIYEKIVDLIYNQTSNDVKCEWTNSNYSVCSVG